VRVGPLSGSPPVMIALMKPIAPSQSKSPTSVPRLAEKSGSMLLFMFGLWSMKAIINDGAPIRFPRADPSVGTVATLNLEPTNRHGRYPTA
jgi:hypothetical protein